MLQRILGIFVLLISVLFWPFWLTVALALALIIYFNVFFEAVLLMLLSDLLHGVPEARFHGIFFVSFFISIIVLVGAEMLKKNSSFSFHQK